MSEECPGRGRSGAKSGIPGRGRSPGLSLVWVLKISSKTEFLGFGLSFDPWSPANLPHTTGHIDLQYQYWIKL